MVTKLTVLSIPVEPGQALLLPRHSVQTLCAVDQPVWATQAGRADDIVLLAGQCVTLHGRAPIVVQGLSGRAVLRVMHPLPWLSRLSAWIACCAQAVVSSARTTLWFRQKFQQDCATPLRCCKEHA